MLQPTTVDTTAERISVIIATYNSANTLQACLDSIYAQRYTNIDIIVIDGGSYDGTIDLLELNSGKLYYWISEKDKGIYDALNKGIARARAQWLYFLGSDDELLPDFSKMVDYLKDPNKIYYANVAVNGGTKSGMLSPYYMAKVGIYHQAIIYPMAVFKKYRYNLKYRIAADYALNMQCYGDKAFAFVYVPLVIAKYNHTGLSSTVVDEPFEQDKIKLIRQNFGIKIWLRFLFRKIKAALGVNKK